MRNASEKTKIYKVWNDAEADNTKMTKNLKICTLSKLLIAREGKMKVVFWENCPSPRGFRTQEHCPLPRGFWTLEHSVPFGMVLSMALKFCCWQRWEFCSPFIVSLAVSGCFSLVWKTNGKIEISIMRLAPKSVGNAPNVYHVWSVIRRRSIKRLEDWKIKNATRWQLIIDVGSVCVMVLRLNWISTKRCRDSRCGRKTGISGRCCCSLCNWVAIIDYPRQRKPVGCNFS